MTRISSGSPMANKVFNAALFTEAKKRHCLANLMTDGAPKIVDSNKLDGRKQTSPGAPVVQILDLSKSKGDEVSMDLFHQLGGEPIMGDDRADGRAESLTFATFSLKINQYRKPVDSGGKMTQQRTGHDLKMVANRMLSPYVTDLRDQVMLVHAAGARGDVPASKGGWLVPENKPGTNFSKVMVNPVTPPTFNRHFYGGDATAIDNIDSADKFNLRAINRLRLQLGEQNVQMQSIRYEKDVAASDLPFFVLLVSERQWFDWQEDTDPNFGGAAFKRLQAAAVERGKLASHPIFAGDCAYYENILIRRMSKDIQFNAGSQVQVSNNDATASVTTKVPSVRVHRAILLGAQGIADAWGLTGKAEKGGYFFDQRTEEQDLGNRMIHSVNWMSGFAKVRFQGSDQIVTDHGVAVLDTAVSTGL